MLFVRSSNTSSIDTVHKRSPYLRNRTYFSNERLPVFYSAIFLFLQSQNLEGKNQQKSDFYVKRPSPIFSYSALKILYFTSTFSHRKIAFQCTHEN